MKCSTRLPERFRKATIDTVDSKHFGMVLSYANTISENISKGVGILLSGPAGVGKSWALAALTNVYVNFDGDRVPDHDFVTAPDLFENYDVYDEAKGWDAYRAQPWTHTYNTVPWLVVNDIGKEYRGGKLGEQIPYKLGRLLRTRCEGKLVTHFSTNLPLIKSEETLSAVYGASIVSLLAEMADVYSVTGKDRRRTRHGT